MRYFEKPEPLTGGATEIIDKQKTAYAPVLDIHIATKQEQYAEMHREIFLKRFFEFETNHKVTSEYNVEQAFKYASGVVALYKNKIEEQQ